MREEYDELDYYLDEVELSLTRNEPLAAELRTYIKASTLRRLQQYCRDQRVSDKVIVEAALAALLYDQGY